MSDDYMKDWELDDDGEWVMVAELKRTFGIQFKTQGQAHVHIGKSEPTEDDAKILVSNVTDETPRTLSFGSLPEDAQVWVRKVGDQEGVQITVVAY